MTLKHISKNSVFSKLEQFMLSKRVFSNSQDSVLTSMVSSVFK